MFVKSAGFAGSDWGKTTVINLAFGRYLYLRHLTYDLILTFARLFENPLFVSFGVCLNFTFVATTRKFYFKQDTFSCRSLELRHGKATQFGIKLAVARSNVAF